MQRAVSGHSFMSSVSDLTSKFISDKIIREERPRGTERR